MTVIIVGSEAGMWHGVIPKRKALDVDIIASWEDSLQYARFLGDISEIRPVNEGKGVAFLLSNGKIVESELTERTEHTRKLYSRISKERDDGLPINWPLLYASPDWLYFLKMSHRFRKDSPHFMKTLKDLKHLEAAGAKMPEGSEELFKEREQLTYKNKLPKLNVETKDFFKKEDKFYVYDHDSIHEAVALDGSPAYTKYIRDGEQVLTDKEKFFAAPERVRLLGGLEEALVLCAERSLIPNNFKPNPDRMFLYALEKVCTTITGGYFREWCYNHWFEIVELYKKEARGVWVEKLKKAIDSGQVRPYNANSTY